jgi:hypothetical protein
MVLVVTGVYKDNYDNVLNFCINNNLQLVVYNKNDDLKLNEEVIKVQTPLFTLIDIPNYGRCDYGFLYHIVKNYSNLPDKILFTKANYMDQNINLNYALNNDYAFVNIGRSIKYGIFDKNYDVNNLLAQGVHKNDIETFFYAKDDVESRELFGNTFNSYIVRDFYKMVYGDYANIPEKPILNMGHGPCFCVTRELIQGHDINIYEKLMDTFYPNKNHWSKWSNHTEEETRFHVGKRYHDNLQRFWSTLFIQNYEQYNVTTDYNNFIGCKITM